MLRILDDHGVELAGRRAVVVGRSLVVGKPVGDAAAGARRDRDHLPLAHRATWRHVRPRRTSWSRRWAGRGCSGRSTSAPGAVVVDVGTTPDENGNLVGDVDTEAVMGRAGAVTPVPGGVGPVTTALLLHNTVGGGQRNGLTRVLRASEPDPPESEESASSEADPPECEMSAL